MCRTTIKTWHKRLFRMSLQALLAFCVVSCSESYPNLYMEEEDNTIYPSNGETGGVPILPSLVDPMFGVYTRGQGQLDYYEDSRDNKENKERWESADFYTFALLTGNQYYQQPIYFDATDVVPQSPSGYAPNSDPIHTLLWNQKMKIKDKNILFFDGDNRSTKFYNWVHQNYKYNFFTYHIDDATIKNAPYVPQDDRTKVKIKFEIDGTQDVIHGLGYHTWDDIQDWQNAVDKANPNGLGTEYKPIMEDVYSDRNAEFPRTDLLYSTMSGHRGLNPRFHVNHLLTSLKFMIIGIKSDNDVNTGGDSEENDAFPENYKQIVVRGITVEAPSVGTMTIANDAWSNPAVYKDDIDNNRLITFDENDQPVNEDEWGLDVKLDMVKVTDTYPKLKGDGLFRDPYDPSKSYDDVSPQWHITKNAITSVGDVIMIPPCPQVKVKLKTDFLDISANGDKLNSPIAHLPDIEYTLNYAGGFKAGNEYTILISVYGVQQVNGSIELDSWTHCPEDLEGAGPESNKNGDHVIAVGGDDEEDSDGL